MKINRESNNILNDCLERLLVKGETIEQCLQDYPERATELKPLLQTALAAKEASATSPRPEFRTQARYQFQSLLQEVASKRSRSFFNWVPRWATTVALVIALLLVGGGTVAAASYSMPDEPLYSLKLATEQVQSAFTFSNLGKVRLYTSLTDKRVGEIVYVASKGDAHLVEVTTRRMNERLTMLTEAVSTTEVDISRTLAPSAPSNEITESGGTFDEADHETNLKTILVYYASNHLAILNTALEAAPESTKSALQQAIIISITGYERSLEALD